MKKLPLAMLLAIVLLPAASAAATDLCVLPANSCTAPNTFAASGTGVVGALAAATGPADRVLIGAGTYVAPTTSGFEYSHPANGVQIIGAGIGQTTLTGPTDTYTLLTLGTSGAGLISNLSLVIARRDAAGYPSGLNETGGSASHVAVTQPVAGNSGGGVGILMDGGTFADGSVTLPMTGSETPLQINAPSTALIRSSLVGRFGAEVSGDNARFTRDTIETTTSSPAIIGHNPGLEISDSLLSGGYAGVYVTTQGGGSADARLDHDTLLAPATGISYGLEAQGQQGLTTASIVADSTIIQGFTHARYAATSTGFEKAQITTSYSDYDPSGDSFQGPGLGSVAAPGPGDVNIDPGYAAPIDNNYSLAPSSPLIDAGDPAVPGPAEGTLDLAGNHRVLDGRGTCVARSDMGAFEYVRPTAVTAVPKVQGPASAGQPQGFDGSSSTDAAGDPITYAWSFDDGGSAAGAAPTHVFTTAGPHNAVLTVADHCGHTASASVGVSIAAPAGQQTTTTSTSAAPTAVPLPAQVRPALSRLLIKVSRKRVPTFGFTLSAPASVRITLQRRLKGHRSGKRCSTAKRSGRRCTILRDAGTLSFAGRAGANSFTAARLRPGSYIASLSAPSAAQVSFSVR